MIEVYPGLFVGCQQDFEDGSFASREWAVVHACKEPHHRKALGYTGRAVDKSHPEYLIARRGNRLILNLVDVADPRWIDDSIMNAAIQFIQENLQNVRSVLVHCNQGCSRAPSIAMLYLGTYTDQLPRDSFERALAVFKEKYPLFAPAGGVYGFLKNQWAGWKSNPSNGNDL
ncbi:dual specificity protein phosphatase family protein [Granulicella arctica]|uniref:dual specificity protein phosphatase family protein n=1 Tax=Granulicella arctica TaxID=940613 RepID=UPI0021DFDFF7|nr:dual specificity protein phosphatase [Granulicella arctica]